MNPGRHIRNLALIGFMGSGKSTVGHLAAHQLGFEFVDTDRLIESHVGRTIAQIFADGGESVFRQFESEVVARVSQLDRTVIATGGGLGANPTHLVALKTHALVVCLWATPEVLWERVRRQVHRPLLQVPDPLGRLRHLLAEREPVYRQADVLINTGPRSFRDVVQHVVREFRRVVDSQHGQAHPRSLETPDPAASP